MCDSVLSRTLNLITSHFFRELNFFDDLSSQSFTSITLSIVLSLHINTLSSWSSLSYRNLSNDLLCQSSDWFLYDRDLRHERVKGFSLSGLLKTLKIDQGKANYSKFSSQEIVNLVKNNLLWI